MYEPEESITYCTRFFFIISSFLRGLSQLPLHFLVSSLQRPISSCRVISPPWSIGALRLFVPIESTDLLLESSAHQNCKLSKSYQSVKYVKIDSTLAYRSVVYIFYDTKVSFHSMYNVMNWNIPGEKGLAPALALAHERNTSI